MFSKFIEEKYFRQDDRAWINEAGIERNNLLSKHHRKLKKKHYLSLNILVGGKLSCIKHSVKKRYAVMQWFTCIKKHLGQNKMQDRQFPGK